MPSALIAAFVALQAPAATLRTPTLRTPTLLTREEALSLPANVLARRLLGATGAIYTEIERPVAPDPLPMGPPGLNSLTFAGAPRWSGYAGICVADVVTVGFQPVGPTVADARQSVQVDSLVTEQRFRIVGDTSGGDRADGSDRERQRRLCDNAGPVLALDRDSRRFFSVRGARGGAHDASYVARIVQQVLTKVATGELAPSCSGAGDCAGSRVAIARFDVTRIATATVDRCPGESAELCVWASMSQPGSSYYREISSSLRIRTGAVESESHRTPAAVGVEHSFTIGES
ncbi:MAG TPA: hypothetical protein VF552_13860 [Allosphingosinicella sp.]|jgi:hypothetical protein